MLHIDEKLRFTRGCYAGWVEQYIACNLFLEMLRMGGRESGTPDPRRYANWSRSQHGRRLVGTSAINTVVLQDWFNRQDTRVLRLRYWPGTHKTDGSV